MEPTRRGGRFCVCGNANNQSCKNTSYSPEIRMHVFPKDPETRNKWIKFVQKHRKDFLAPSQYSTICSAHFEDSCYARRAELNEEASLSSTSRAYRVLTRGSLPTKDSMEQAGNDMPEVSGRAKRQVCSHIYLGLTMSGLSLPRPIHLKCLDMCKF